jgi:hypothetical protein
MKKQAFCHLALYLVVIFLLVLLSKCTIHPPSDDYSLTTIDIENAIINNEPLLLSDIAQGNIEYIKLDSNVDCLLGKNVRIYLNDSALIAFANNQIYLFDRETGAFLKEIGSQGSDPNGYRSTLYSFPYDHDRNKFYANSWFPNSFNEYDISGNLISKFVVEPEDGPVTSMAHFKDSIFVGHIWNYDGKQKIRLVVFDKMGTIIKTYPQFLGFEYDMNIHGISVLHWDGWFYKYSSNLYFFERFSDTIFVLSPESMLPRYVFSNGTFGIPYSKRYEKEYLSNPYNYLNFRSIFESQRFLVFTYSYQKKLNYGIYDKVKKKTLVSDSVGGLINDLDNFLPFNFYSVNDRNEIIGFKEAFEIKEWFNENPEKIQKLPPHLQRLNNIDEMDNPVVMIVKLKE